MPVQKTTGFPTQPHHPLHVIIGTFRKVHSQTWKPVLRQFTKLSAIGGYTTKLACTGAPHWRHTGEKQADSENSIATSPPQKWKHALAVAKGRGSHHASCTSFHTPAGSILLDHNLVLHFRSNTVARATTTLRIKSNLFGGGRWVGNFLGDCKL